MDERVRFIADVRAGEGSFAEVCERYGVSRQSGYKWLRRYEAEGPAGLVEQSRRPQSCPHATAREQVEALVEVRRRHPTWGAKKLLWVLERRHPDWVLPGRTTCCDLLKRHGLVEGKRRRRFPGHPGRPLTPMEQPNEVWTADFKGQFRTRDRKYCYPLTVADGFSRFLLGCQGLRSTAVELARPVFQRLFEEYGLPDIIRTDNGVPFATTALGRLSALSVWWIRLGIYPELIEPAHPEQNGRHERMHRTLKRETARPPCGSLAAQQVRFNQFRQEYNQERPHEALDQQTPASLYRRSLRELPRKLPELEYPAHYEVRYVSANGGLRWRCHWVCLTHTLDGQHVGLEEVGDGLWDVYFGPVKLGRLDERKLRIEDHKGRWIRRTVSTMSPD
jgi:transposase InsO family protein